MISVDNIIQTGGLLAIALIVFAESGILLGFFLPGDTLLLTAGLFAGEGKLPLGWLILIIIVSAILGYQVGYKIGEKAGPQMFKRDKGILFRKEYIHRTQRFFERYGRSTVVLARFVAHVRTFVSVIAGAARMNKTEYLIYNIVGAVLWGGGVTLLGYWLGASVPHVDKILVPVIVIFLVVFYTVAAWQVLKTPERRRRIREGLKEDWDYLFGRDKLR